MLKTPMGERKLPVHGRSCQPLNPLSDHHELTSTQQPSVFSHRWKVFSSDLRRVETDTTSWLLYDGTWAHVVGPTPGIWVMHSSDGSGGDVVVGLTTGTSVTA